MRSAQCLPSSSRFDRGGDEPVGPQEAGDRTRDLTVGEDGEVALLPSSSSIEKCVFGGSMTLTSRTGCDLADLDGHRIYRRHTHVYA